VGAWSPTKERTCGSYTCEFYVPCVCQVCARSVRERRKERDGVEGGGVRE